MGSREVGLCRIVEQRAVWEAIADSFDATRSRPWPFVQDFLDTLAPDARMLDLMAGNGRHTALRDNVVALDWSRRLLSHCRDRAPGAAVVQAEASRLPFVDAAFDAAIYIAGLHGIEDARARQESLRELRRVLAPGGRLLVSVWDRASPRFARAGRTGPQDVRVPWRRDGHDRDRFYHLYTEASLTDAMQRAGFRAALSRHGDNLVAHANR